MSAYDGERFYHKHSLGAGNSEGARFLCTIFIDQRNTDAATHRRRLSRDAVDN